MSAKNRRMNLPLVYACSGCSDVAQLANRLAVEWDRAGIAEMSCIAGVGGDVPSLVRKAQSGRPIVAIDGCPLHCVKSCLARHGVEATLAFTLTDFGLKKGAASTVSETDAARVKKTLEPSVAWLRAENLPSELARDP